MPVNLQDLDQRPKPSSVETINSNKLMTEMQDHPPDDKEETRSLNHIQEPGRLVATLVTTNEVPFKKINKKTATVSFQFENGPIMIQTVKTNSSDSMKRAFVTQMVSSVLKFNCRVEQQQENAE